MRLRRKPYAKEMVQKHPRVVLEPERVKGFWKELFGNDRPIHVELGTGKGRFLSTVCRMHPRINWIGVERIEDVLLQACRKSDETDCDNLRFLWMDIQHLNEVFAEGEVEKILLHFSDPWPKKRHAKRRLTHHRFLNLYRKILTPSGTLQLKTDNESLFAFTLEELEHCGFRLLEFSRDFHRSPYARENVQTEYEEKFSERGLPIYYLLARPSSAY
ncbi:tRNA (guanosine(46)-N7)-methyltransferase TrmB [Paludifilum halophilum]|uniref:tRNA (guanine-N(7)-)-methyltransferase n=1 Tax=Paludifilum halophilum TaxID=1642702 RepID=A0A235B9J2_9BACL|nr:tRNA (guanosine(46)-N7)-methyltransferase TrmB [Paludifilum halophilum]OYD08983.1 tRNA (guanosine(46)-N7)-methyltransferase TrmB [Paludifilum halophilum]